MFIAYDQSNELVEAKNAMRKGHYFCYACGEPLILKRGKIILPHFAHQRGCICNDGWTHPKMCNWHREMQALFNTTEVAMENKQTGERHIADAVYKDIVFEFQHSQISSDEVAKRTRFYLSQGYRVAWVVDLSDKLITGKIRIIDNEAGVFYWPRASKMFYELPFYCSEDIQVVFSWKNAEENPNIRYGNNYTLKTYLNCVGWAYDQLEYNYTNQPICRPDLRFFAIVKKLAVHKNIGFDPEELFVNKPADENRYIRIAQDYIDEQEERASYYHYFS